MRERLGPGPVAWVPRLFGDPRTSRCFPIPNGHPISGIRLNLAGREPEGVLRPGEEADRFCDQLERDLLDIVDERTGKPIVARVLRTDDVHPGDRRDVLPDLLVEWEHLPPTGTVMHAGGRGSEVRVRSDKIGTLTGVNSWHRTGQHVRDGWYTAAGPGIEHSSEPRTISLLDVHPTVCGLLDVPVPDAEGSVVPELGGTRTENRQGGVPDDV